MAAEKLERYALSLNDSDAIVAGLVKSETQRQEFGLELIPSENLSSRAVREALGSVFTDKYSEGYSGKRYYGGNEFVDKAETLAVERAKKLFGVPHANVQPYSGSPANHAVYFAVCSAGDTIMGLSLPDGGHLTHGWKVNFSAKYYKSVQYHVKPDGFIDIEEVKKLAQDHKPKLIWCGATAYPREFPFEEMGKIADSCGAFFACDIAHIAGLIVAGAHKSPVPFAHIITTTTHKTLRGPRGAMILVTQKGLDKDPELAKKIDAAVFPALQGGPHDHQTAAIAVALGEALKPEFKEYGQQVVKNCKAFAGELMDRGIKLVSNGTENHMILVDLTTSGAGKGLFAQHALELAGITTNKNTIPAEPFSPFYPSGLRIGTPTLTSRGMKEQEMALVAEWISRALKKIEGFEMPKGKEERKEAIKSFYEEIAKDGELKKIREEVKGFCKKFPVHL